jgi:hypothetical protein
VLPSAPSTSPGSTTPPTTAEPTTGKSPAVPAVLSIAIDYSCGDGSTGSADVPTGDLELIDDTVNTIYLCEFRGGLAEISFVASCPSGDRPVTVPASDAGLSDLATLDLCETTVAAPAEPALPAVSSIAIDYSCGDGSTGSADVPTGDLELIDDTVNTIYLCEFRGGLAEISLVASCPSGDRPVTVPASDAGLPDLATLDLCETTA